MAKKKGPLSRERRVEPQYRPRVPYEKPSALHGSPRPAAAACPEEEELAKSLADEIAYSIALAATDPQTEDCCCENVILAAVRRRLAGLDARKHKEIQARAHDLLGRDAREQARYFGSFAGRGAARRPGGAVLNRQRRALLERAVRYRIDEQRGDISALHRFHIAGGLQAFLGEKTTLEGVVSFELAEFYTERNLNQTETLTFRWSTEVEEAEIGQWRLLRLPSRSVVASGSAGVGQLFTIDLDQYLAPQPSTFPQLFEVVITPSTAPRFEKQPGASPGSTITVKIPSQAVGLPSNPVRIAYVRDPSLPQVFDEVNVYRKLELHVDHIEMVDQQSGLGNDEYWLYGTIQEIAGTTRKVHELQKTFASLPEPDATPNRKAVNDVYSFHLEYPSSSRWPKTYAVILTLLEEDGGDDVAEWMGWIWNAATGWLGDAIFDKVSEELEDLGLAKYPSQAAAASVAAVAAAIAGSITAAVGGLVLGFVAGILAIVTQAVADDFYGTKVVTLVLPTNTEDYVTQLPGDAQPDGSFRLRPRRPKFRYETPGGGSVKLRDGVVEVQLHWEFKDREFLLGGA